MNMGSVLTGRMCAYPVRIYPEFCGWSRDWVFLSQNAAKAETDEYCIGAGSDFISSNAKLMNLDFRTGPLRDTPIDVPPDST